MSEILARIRVRETHGIRRFLYPLTARVNLPQFGAIDFNQLDTSAWSLTDSENEPVPLQILYYGNGHCYADFAVSLEPYADTLFTLKDRETQRFLDDPLSIAIETNNVSSEGDYFGPLASTQKQFSLTFVNGRIYRAKYSGVEHLRQPSTVVLNSLTMSECDFVSPPEGETVTFRTNGSLCLEMAKGMRWASTEMEITACKSWVKATYSLVEPQQTDEIVFTLPLAIKSPTLTCDFGVGGYVFGKLDANATEIVWRTEFGDAPYAKWSVATAGRVDYVGEVETAEAFISQRWFHLIDCDKALAVAITKLPDCCREMTVRLTHEGDVSIAFVLGEAITGPAEFGVCYHFLNDVPAIAAATNPQSILLPPVVEVLPV